MRFFLHNFVYMKVQVFLGPNPKLPQSMLLPLLLNFYMPLLQYPLEKYSQETPKFQQ